MARTGGHGTRRAEPCARDGPRRWFRARVRAAAVARDGIHPPGEGNVPVEGEDARTHPDCGRKIVDRGIAHDGRRRATCTTATALDAWRAGDVTSCMRTDGGAATRGGGASQPHDAGPCTTGFGRLHI